MANKLEKTSPPPPPRVNGVSTSCHDAVKARVFRTFGGRGYRITPADNSGVRWRLEKPTDPFTWYVTGSCNGGYVTLDLSSVRRGP